MDRKTRLAVKEAEMRLRFTDYPEPAELKPVDVGGGFPLLPKRRANNG